MNCVLSLSMPFMLTGSGSTRRLTEKVMTKTLSIIVFNCVFHYHLLLENVYFTIMRCWQMCISLSYIVG